MRHCCNYDGDILLYIYVCVLFLWSIVGKTIRKRSRKNTTSIINIVIMRFIQFGWPFLLLLLVFVLCCVVLYYASGVVQVNSLLLQCCIVCVCICTWVIVLISHKKLCRNIVTQANKIRMKEPMKSAGFCVRRTRTLFASFCILKNDDYEEMHWKEKTEIHTFVLLSLRYLLLLLLFDACKNGRKKWSRVFGVHKTIAIKSIDLHERSNKQTKVQSLSMSTTSMFFFSLVFAKWTMIAKFISEYDLWNEFAQIPKLLFYIDSAHFELNSVLHSVNSDKQQRCGLNFICFLSCCYLFVLRSETAKIRQVFSEIQLTGHWMDAGFLNNFLP